MKKLVTIIAVALTAVSFAADAKIPKSIKMRYAEVSTTMRNRDVKAFKGNFASDFTAVDPKGKSQTKEEFFKEIEPMFKMATKITPNVKLLSSKMHEDLIDVNFDFHLTIMGKNGTTHVHEVGTDTWKQENGKWVMWKTVDKVLDVKMPKAKKMGKMSKMSKKGGGR